MDERMTEQEWLTCTDSEEMAVFLYYHFKDPEYPYTHHKQRKLSLLASACLRRIWHLLTDERCRQAVDVTEKTAEGMEWDHACIVAHRAALDGWGAMADEADERKYATPLLCAMPDAGLAAYHAIDGDLQCVGNAAHAAASFTSGTLDTNSPDFQTALANEMHSQIQLTRCIFGNPFHAVALDPSWLTLKVLTLAHTTYQQRNLPDGTLKAGHIADALEEAGCSDADILAHCRQPGQHVRGCWVVDLVLKKE